MANFTLICLQWKLQPEIICLIMQNKNCWDAHETCCSSFMILVSSSKCLFFLPSVSCRSLSNVENQSPVLQSSSIVCCGSWRGEQLIKKNNPEMFEVIYKTCYFLYSSVKCLLCWEFLLYFYKTLSLGNIMMLRCFWSSIKWMESDGGNFWFPKICFLCWFPSSAVVIPGWALSLSDPAQLPCSRVSWWMC